MRLPLKICRFILRDILDIQMYCFCVNLFAVTTGTLLYNDQIKVQEIFKFQGFF